MLKRYSKTERCTLNQERYTEARGTPRQRDALRQGAMRRQKGREHQDREIHKTERYTRTKKEREDKNERIWVRERWERREMQLLGIIVAVANIF